MGEWARIVSKAHDKSEDSKKKDAKTQDVKK